LRRGWRLTLIIAEAALETVPRELWGHPAVYKSARKRGKSPGQILLDRSLHHQAMKTLPKAEKRGRPDIVHITLLEALGSPLNREGMLETYVHTVGDYVIAVNPETRLPRNYNRFVGLMEQLFETGRVPPDSQTPLLTLKPMRLDKLLETVNPSKTILMVEDGRPVKLRELAETITSEEKPAVIVGGFPHGDFEPETRRLADIEYSIYNGKPLETWTVVSHILAAVAISLGIV
jgi:rRNA small subunit pseudouridine methyltransferase Nep1